jgi:hypothetical protein
MCSAERYEHLAIGISDMNDQTIFDTANIENQSVVSDKIDIGTEHVLDVGRPCPFTFADS